jgi:hypothetical protein
MSRTREGSFYALPCLISFLPCLPFAIGLWASAIKGASTLLKSIFLASSISLIPSIKPAGLSFLVCSASCLASLLASNSFFLCSVNSHSSGNWNLFFGFACLKSTGTSLSHALSGAFAFAMSSLMVSPKWRLFCAWVSWSSQLIFTILEEGL